DGAQSTAETEIRSVGRALEILTCFSTATPEWGVTELSEYLGLSKGVIHRLLRTLTIYGFVEQLSSKRYTLGMKTLELGNAVRFNRRLLLHAEPVLQALAATIPVVVHLA